MWSATGFNSPEKSTDKYYGTYEVVGIFSYWVPTKYTTIRRVSSGANTLLPSLSLVYCPSGRTLTGRDASIPAIH